MTARELMALVNREGEYQPTGGAVFRVLIVDAKPHFGGVHLMITPKDGYGTQWVADTSVTLIDTVPGEITRELP